MAVGGAEIHAVERMWFHDGLFEGWAHFCFQFICKLGEIKQACATSLAKNSDAIQTIFFLPPIPESHHFCCSWKPTFF